jgi:hypothetical protein
VAQISLAFAYVVWHINVHRQINRKRTMNTTQAKTIYQVKNIRTGKVVAQYDDKNKARDAVDRKDNAYGACVHGVFEVQA